MTATTRKPLEEYFADVLDCIEFNVRCNSRTGQIFEFATVPSSTREPHMVGLDGDGDAAWCDCGDHCYRHNICKHMQAVDRKNSIEAAEAVAAQNDKTFEQAEADFTIRLDDFYAVRGAEMEAKKREEAPLNGHRVVVAASTNASSVEKNLARFGLLK
jgi:hypothetical protein